MGEGITGVLVDRTLVTNFMQAEAMVVHLKGSCFMKKIVLEFDKTCGESINVIFTIM